MVMKKKGLQTTHLKKQQLAFFGIMLVSLIVLNIFAEAIYRRIDLTKEKRYTLSPASKALVDKLDDVIYFNIFLEGDMPSSYKRLRTSTKDMLNEFRHASGGKIEFHFEDILEGKAINEKEDIIKQLYNKGVQYARPEISEEDATNTDKYIIPGGTAFYKGVEYPVNFLKREFGRELEAEINGSIELLEYEIGNALRKALTGKEVKIAFTQGHGELEYEDVADISKSLSEFYKVESINLNMNDTNFLKRYAAKVLENPANQDQLLIDAALKDMLQYKGLIVAKPRFSFTSTEKFLLDQYTMNGGRIIWLVDALIADIDSVAKYPSLMTADYDINLNDLFFKYGVRINPTLVQDLQCHGIPVLQQKGGSRPGFLPWIFYPTFSPDSKHPIARNLTSVWGRFVNNIDTVSKGNQTKTVLLHSSEQSRLAYNPVSISMNIVAMKPDKNLFIKGNQTTALLVEGEFKSPFKYRDGFKDKTSIQFKDQIANNKMIFIADGDLIANQKSSRGEIYPLGYDRFASSHFGEPVQFANTKFFLNCVDYLCDESNLIEVRSKEIVLRLLNKPKVKEEKRFWQMFNMVLPLIVLLLFGLLNAFIRKRKYTR
jgi:ABC-2 type transport system permease protein